MKGSLPQEALKLCMIHGQSPLVSQDFSEYSGAALTLSTRESNRRIGDAAPFRSITLRNGAASPIPFLARPRSHSPLTG